MEKLPETPTLKKIKPIDRHTLVNRKGAYLHSTASEYGNDLKFSVTQKLSKFEKNPAREKNFERLNDRSTKDGAK